MFNFRRFIPFCIFALSACGGGEASYRYRMTVEVDTLKGLATGSAVREESARYGDFVLSETGKGAGATFGEAVVVDLPSGPLFVLLKLPDGNGSLGDYVTAALARGERTGGFDGYFKQVRQLGGWFGGAEADLPRAEWPLMVRFRDLDDPTTVERVDPNAAGVRRIQLETTGDEVTQRITERLPWLPRVYQLGISRNFHPAGVPVGDFKRLFSTELDR